MTLVLFWQDKIDLFILLENNADNFLGRYQSKYFLIVGWETLVVQMWVTVCAHRRSPMSLKSFNSG
jgi:hypothetical protein